ncbi:MAG TPA: DoxX family protein [Puia sp.]|nr:DoxX family protein [Puia sp.]
MSKTNRIIYWIVTIWLAAGMLAGGVQQLLQIGGYVGIIGHLGYPKYFMSIIGVWKILGVIAILVPRFRLLKEWAYAGFFFVMSGAVISHLVMRDTIAEILPSLSLLILTALSWYFRPAGRKVILVHQ